MAYVIVAILPEMATLKVIIVKNDYHRLGFYGHRQFRKNVRLKFSEWLSITSH